MFLQAWVKVSVDVLALVDDSDWLQSRQGWEVDSAVKSQSNPIRASIRSQ